MSNEKKALQIIKDMEPWWRDLESKKPSRDGRTRNEVCFDNGVFAAAEFVRRMTGDESLALLTLEACSWKRKKRKEEQT